MATLQPVKIWSTSFQHKQKYSNAILRSQWVPVFVIYKCFYTEIGVELSIFSISKANIYLFFRTYIVVTELTSVSCAPSLQLEKRMKRGSECAARSDFWLITYPVSKYKFKMKHRKGFLFLCLETSVYPLVGESPTYHWGRFSPT